MVIRLPIEDGHRPIELFDEDEADHLMGEGHLTEGDLFRGGPIDRFAKAIGTSHHEH